MKPYIDNDDIRTFDVSLPSEQYVWHRDNEDRQIEVLEGKGWQFQIEGCLPFLLKKGFTFTIEKGVYHRLIKGVDDLRIRINKIKDYKYENI